MNYNEELNSNNEKLQEILNAVNNLPDGGGGSTIPNYVKAEADLVADKILSSRNADTFVIACASDLHTNGSDVSAAGVLHAGQAMNIIQSMTELDLVAILGDVCTGHFETNAAESFKYVKKCFADVAKSVPYMHLQGNHDELSNDTTEVAQQKYYAFIGANNVGTVTDYANKFRNYGYRDFENYKVRVIYLNTADVSENEMTYDNNLTPAQMTWFINTALNYVLVGLAACGRDLARGTAQRELMRDEILVDLDAGGDAVDENADARAVAFAE